MSHTDTFWKLFWIVVGALALVYFLVVIGLIYFYNPTKTADAAAVGIVFDSSRDPFEGQRPSDKRPNFSGDVIYDDSLPLAFADWSWGVQVNWNSKDISYEGLDSFKIHYLQDWSGVRVQASGIDLTSYEGVSLAVYPESGLQDLYIELFDNSGNSLGKQSLSWYADNASLVMSKWNSLTIPFDNLFPEGQPKRAISGLAISTIKPGVAYVDSMRLETSVPMHSRWYEPKPIEWKPEPPPPPIPLPYSLETTPESFQQWKTVFGRFELTPTGVRIGTTPEKTSGSMSYIKGGQNWTDYSVDTKLYWGQTSAFSILVRYVDDGTFISCAFSHYNETVQMYKVKKGVSNLLGTAPAQPIRAIEPWKDAKAGASVEGKRVSCFVDGERALSYEIPDVSATGTAALETWTQNTYDSPHTLQEFTVKSL